MRNEIVKMFRDGHGIEVQFTDQFPEGIPEHHPAAWASETCLMIGVPPQAHQFDVAYAACGAFALAEGFTHNQKPSGAALTNAWALRKAIELYGSNDRVIEILKSNVSVLFSQNKPAAEAAYVLWSRIVAADVREILRPIRMSRPEVAEMIETIDREWHIPDDSDEAYQMRLNPPVPDPD